MDVEPTHRHAVRRAQRILPWILALVPPVAWAVQFEMVYVMAPANRRPMHVGAIRWVSLLALAAAATSTWLSHGEFEEARRALQPLERRSRPSVWLARSAIGIGVFFCAVIMATALISWLMSPED